MVSRGGERGWKEGTDDDDEDDDGDRAELDDLARGRMPAGGRIENSPNAMEKKSR